MISKLSIIDQLAMNYKIYTDKYFLRAKSILQQEDINPIVRYQVFVRKNIVSLKGVNEAIYFIKKIVGDKVRIYALEEGKPYVAGQPIIKLEGRVQDLVDIETVYLGILSGSLTGRVDLEEVRKNAHAISVAAEDKKVYYFGARHFFPWLDEKIAKICHEVGFAGCSTDVGAKAWDAEGGGTISHSLILVCGIDMKERDIEGNPTLEATKAFDRGINGSIPRVALIDTFNFEKSTIDIFTNPEAKTFIMSTAKSYAVFGVATDYCVKDVVLGMRRRNIPVYVIVDAIKGVAKETTEEALCEMAEVGAQFIHSTQLRKILNGR